MGDLARTFDLVSELYLDGFIAAVAVGLAAPCLGTLLVLRRMPILGLAVPELAGSGVAAAYLVFPWFASHALHAAAESAGLPEGPPAWLQAAGALTAVMAGFLALAATGGSGRAAGMHALVALVLARGLSEIFLLESDYHEVSGEWLHHGRLLTIQPLGSYIVLGASAISVVVVVLSRRGLWITAFDPDLGRLQGRSPARWLFATLSLVGGFCAVTVPEVGPDVILAVMAVPPLVIRSSAPSLRSYAPWCSAAGVAGVLVAFHLAVDRDWPVGPSLTFAVLLTSAAVAIGLQLASRIGRVRA